MQRYGTERIRDVVQAMKAMKASSFINEKGDVDFKNVTETCRMVDAYILPIYYIWEHRLHGNLSDLSFEEHLQKPYQKFSENPLSNTCELYLLLKLNEGLAGYLKEKLLMLEVSKIYETLINTLKNVKKCSNDKL